MVSHSGTPGAFVNDSNHVSNSPIVYSATFNSTTHASLGFTTGLLGTWELAASFGLGAKSTVVIGPPATELEVPGSLPLLGAAADIG